MTRAFSWPTRWWWCRSTSSRLPLIAVVGALFYGEPFDPMAIAGAAVIFAGTYYSLSRERR